MSIAKNISSSFFYQIGITLLNFIATIVITRLIGPNGRGDIAIYNNAVAIATTFFSFSLGSAIVHFVASKKMTPQQAFSNILAALLVSILILCIAITIAYYCGVQYTITPFANTYSILIMFATHVIFTILNLNLSALLNAKDNFIFPLQLQLANLLILLCGLYAVTLANITNPLVVTTYIVYCIVFLNTLQVIMLLFYSARQLEISFYNLSWNKLLSKQLFAFSALAFLCNIVQILSYRMDLWFLQHYQTSAIVGVYSIAVLFVQMLWILPNQFSNVLYTKFNQLHDNTKTIIFIININAITFWACLILFTVAWGISYVVIPFLFGTAFSESSKLLGILLLGAIPIASALIISTFNASKRQLVVNLNGSIIGLILCLILNAILIPKYGYYGAAFASAISYLGNCIFLYSHFSITYQINWKALFLPDWNYIKNIKQHWHELQQ